MPYPAESIWEILDISPGAPLPAIMRAYQQALRSGKFPKNMVAQAFSDARNPRKRAEATLLAYPVANEPVAIEALLSEPPPIAPLPDTVTPMPIAAALTDMAAGDRSIDFLDVPNCPLGFRATDRLLPSADVLPPLPFPT